MITIGITTHNRWNILTYMAKSFYSSYIPYPYSIRIYDDASTEYGEEDLKRLFPDAVYIYRQKRNVGADANTLYMYQDFLKSGDAVLFNADSDLIFSREWMLEGIKYLEESDGILSIFNTKNHAVIGRKGNLLIKEDIGAAGTFFRRETLKNFVEYIEKNQLLNKAKSTIDYTFSDYYNSTGIQLFVTPESFAQHIGLDGYNSEINNFDFGSGFKVDSLINGQILNDVLEKSISKRDAIPKKYALFPFELVNRGARIVLYGAGKVGRDYAIQIQHSGYCDLVAIVDRNYEKISGVLQPQVLPKLEFDVIVLATTIENIANSMRRDIVSLFNGESPIIVYRNDSFTIRTDASLNIKETS